MKSVITTLTLAILGYCTEAQTIISKSYPVNKNQNITFNFDFPKVIKVSTWDKSEVAITAKVSINDGENDKDFHLLDSLATGELTISNKIDWDKIPDTYYVQENGIKTRFNSKQDLENYKKQNPNKLNNVSIYQQKKTEITLEIKVPASANTSINSTYGIIELADFNGNVKAVSKFGGIDAKLNEQEIGKIKLSNRFGKIYSDLKLNITESTEKNFYTSITAQSDKGYSYDISSSFGNIYLRKKP